MASDPGPVSRRGTRGPATVLKVAAFALLLGECVVILIPSIYGRAAPKLFGIPFFYWFQLLWIIVAMFVTGIAYLLVEHADSITRRASPGVTGTAHDAGGASR